MQRYGYFFDFGYKYDIFSVYIRFPVNTVKPNSVIRNSC